jgi:hypothetical protein
MPVASEVNIFKRQVSGDYPVAAWGGAQHGTVIADA